MSDLIDRVRAARKNPGIAVVEGFHAFKHALRFGARPTIAVARNADDIVRLAGNLAPDIEELIAESVTSVGDEVFDRLAPVPPPTGVIALFERPAVDLPAMLTDPRPEPIVLVERPARLGNVGAVVRVAAAAGAAGVLTSGPHDPWHPEAIRGAAGLHFAVPVARVESLPDTDRPIVAVDPGGEPLGPSSLPGRPLLVFGSERKGLSDVVRRHADLVVAIPMRPGVSSLNLATSVAVVLYAVHHDRRTG